MAANDNLYKLGKETEFNPSASKPPLQVLQTVEAILPFSDWSAAVVPASWANDTAPVDQITLTNDSRLRGVSLAALAGSDIAAKVVVQAGTNTYVFPARLSKGGISTGTNYGGVPQPIGQGIVLSFPFPNDIFCPAGSIIQIFAFSTTGSSSDIIGFAYDIISANGVA